MKKLLILFMLLPLMACQQSQNQFISLFNDFELDDEQISERDEQIVYSGYGNVIIVDGDIMCLMTKDNRAVQVSIQIKDDIVSAIYIVYIDDDTRGLTYRGNLEISHDNMIKVLAQLDVDDVLAFINSKGE